MVAVIVFILVVGYLMGSKLQYREDRKNLADNLLKKKGRKK